MPCDCQLNTEAIYALVERVKEVESRLDARDKADVDKEQADWEEYMGDDL